MTSLFPSHVALDTCSCWPPRPATVFLLSEPSSMYIALTVASPCTRSIVSILASCFAVNSWPKPAPPPPPRPPPRPPPPPPAGAPAGGAAGADAGSMTHLPEKSGLAWACIPTDVASTKAAAVTNPVTRMALPLSMLWMGGESRPLLLPADCNSLERGNRAIGDFLHSFNKSHPDGRTVPCGRRDRLAEASPVVRRPDGDGGPAENRRREPHGDGEGLEAKPSGIDDQERSACRDARSEHVTHVLEPPVHRMLRRA